MPHLLNRKLNPGGFTSNLRRSFGPYLSLDEDNYLFDASERSTPLWLGYNASPLFGMLQFSECWSGNDSSQMELVRNAFQQLLLRSGNDASCAAVDGIKQLAPAALLYHYICQSVLEQYADEYRAAAATVEKEFDALLQKNSALLQSPAIDSSALKFSFDVESPAVADQFEAASYQAGIHLTRSANRFLFQLNLAYRPEQMRCFWQQMNRLVEDFQGSWTHEAVEISNPAAIEATYRFHELLIRSKSQQQFSQLDAIEYLNSQLKRFGHGLVPVVLTAANYAQYRPAILQMQQDVYEPVRRSPPDEFDMLFESGTALAIAVIDNRVEQTRIIAMSFAGRLGLFTQERGVNEDPFLDDHSTYYSMDLTIDENFRGGLGRVMKQAMVLLALKNGVGGMHGRNRDRLARGMWAINLSLGSFELQHLEDDYPDEGPHRDCIYYRCPFQWPDSLSDDQLREVVQSIPGMVNGFLLHDVIVEA
ncbi:MAG: hypothetical protein AAF456_00935 [Planctomycetota bacterium]